MIYNETIDFNRFCEISRKFSIDPTKEFFEKYVERILYNMDIKLDDDFFLFLKEFWSFEPHMQNEVGTHTVCSLIRYIRHNVFRDDSQTKQKIWWATFVAERMTKSMNAKLMEYKEREKKLQMGSLAA
jgi:hypothetical protein